MAITAAVLTLLSSGFVRHLKAVKCPPFYTKGKNHPQNIFVSFIRTVCGQKRKKKKNLEFLPRAIQNRCSCQFRVLTSFSSLHSIKFTFFLHVDNLLLNGVCILKQLL